MEEGLPGDHRSAWIDVPAALLFGHNPPDLHRVYPPGLVVNDPRIRTKYNKEVKAKLKSKGMLKKAALLRKMVADNLASPDSPPHSLQEVNALHLQLNNARRDVGWEVAAKIRKRHTGAHPFP